MPSITTGSSGPRRQIQVSRRYFRYRNTRRTRPLTPVSRARSAAYSSTPSQANAHVWIPWLKRQACHGSTREFTIDSTLRRDSRWDVALQRLQLQQISTRSPRAQNKARTTVIAGSSRPLGDSGVVLSAKKKNPALRCHAKRPAEHRSRRGVETFHRSFAAAVAVTEN